MFLQPVIHGVVLGVLLGVLLGYDAARGWQLRARRTRDIARRRRDIDRLVEQFQALFRQIDQEKQ